MVNSPTTNLLCQFQTDPFLYVALMEFINFLAQFTTTISHYYRNCGGEALLVCWSLEVIMFLAKPVCLEEIHLVVCLCQWNRNWVGQTSGVEY